MKKGLIAAALASVAFGLVLATWLEPFIASDVRIAANGSQWPKTNGTVLESRSYPLSSKSFSIYKAVVTYKYEVSGRQYQRSQVLCDCSSGATSDELLVDLTSGRLVQVSYDPSDPSLSVINVRGFDAEFLTKWGLELIVILMFAIVLPLGLWLLSSNSTPHRDGREALRSGQSSSAPARGRER
jgi:hypothetical protein